MLSTRTFAFAALLGLAASACTQSKNQQINPNTGAKQPVAVGPAVVPGVTPGVDPNEQQNGNVNGGVNGATVGMSEADFQNGKTYVNGWDGLADQLPGDTGWTVKTLVAPPPPAPATPASPAQPQGPQVAPQPAAPANPPANPEEIVFRIPKGTGRNAWNTKETEVVVKVGKKFTIVNDDDIVHQWHTNGSPCQHGNPIQPGKSETCTPSRAFTEGPLYDHITEGKFYIRAEQ